MFSAALKTRQACHVYSCKAHQGTSGVCVKDANNDETMSR